MNTLQTISDVNYKGYTIRVKEYNDKGNWSYTFYSITNGKWKRERAMQGYNNSEKALRAAETYIDNFKSKP